MRPQPRLSKYFAIGAGSMRYHDHHRPTPNEMLNWYLLSRLAMNKSCIPFHFITTIIFKWSEMVNPVAHVPNPTNRTKKKKQLLGDLLARLSTHAAHLPPNNLYVTHVDFTLNVNYYFRLNLEYDFCSYPKLFRRCKRGQCQPLKAIEMRFRFGRWWSIQLKFLQPWNIVVEANTHKSISEQHVCC